MTFEKRIVKIAVCPVNKPLFDEQCTYVEIVDEAAGEFIEISQVRDDSDKTVRIDAEEWPLIRDAISEMAKMCRGE